MNKRYVVARNEKGDVVKVIECETDFDGSVCGAHLERRAKKWGPGNSSPDLICKSPHSCPWQ